MMLSLCINFKLDSISTQFGTELHGQVACKLSQQLKIDVFPEMQRANNSMYRQAITNITLTYPIP